MTTDVMSFVCLGFIACKTFSPLAPSLGEVKPLHCPRLSCPGHPGRRQHGAQVGLCSWIMVKPAWLESKPLSHEGLGIAQPPWSQVACLHPQFSLQDLGPGASYVTPLPQFPLT